MKIELKTMTLQNFKKERSKTITFAHNTIISGGNETGKSTIYDAYLWCLFGITSRPDTTVQTLDKHNNVIHKLETSVVVILNYNDERDVKIERRLSERWKGKDTSDEKFLGTTQARLVDDVPYSVSAFKEKLNSLCDFDDWFMLSNINLFWTYKVDVRRKILMSLAGEINEENLMTQYPAVYKGVMTEKKDIAEMFTQQKATRKKANDELQTIPAKVQAQDMLKSDEDFAELEKEKIEVDKQISSIDASLQGVIVNVDEQKEYQNRLAEEEKIYEKTRKEWADKHFACVNYAFEKVNTAAYEMHEAIRIQKKNIDNNVENRCKLAELTKEFNELMQRWNNVNEKEFNFAQTDVCPVCGRPYTEEMKNKEYENAVAEFNAHKSEELAKIQKAASEKNSQIAIIKGNINTFEQITAAKDNEKVKVKTDAHNILNDELAKVKAETWEQSEEKKKADASLQAIKNTEPTTEVDASAKENKQKKQELTVKRDDLIKRISGRDMNERIEKEKEKLDARSRELAQIVADCNEVIRQIKEYKKAKIAIVENNVNSFFSLIRWKFYEQNITNDDEKEVCTAIDSNGVDYNNTNDGTVINMGIDIINGISKAKNVYVPLFVDRKESVEKALTSTQQSIYLQCKYGELFNVELL
ncbi:AAA family ATPase [Leyella stercorea]|uniref:AAA family ATPase n=1 Tax=Leyella stercorea TaxID=363265 RepID=UPI00266C8653|nr:AAA family ATPase [Leyella stercorea]